MEGEQAKVFDPSFKGNATKTNSGINEMMANTGKAGKAVLGVGAAVSLYTVATSNDPVREATTETAGGAAAMTFGAEGAAAWSLGGPWASTAGGLLGSAGGFFLGKNGAEGVLQVAPVIRQALSNYKATAKAEGCNICNLDH